MGELKNIQTLIQINLETPSVRMADKNRRQLAMLRLLSILCLGLLIGCNANHTQYYYGQKQFRNFLCYWTHYIVIEDKGDSLQVWDLDDECNSGYGYSGNVTLAKSPGIYDDFTIRKITDRKIDLIYDRGYEKVKFTLTRARNKHKAIKVINITQMLTIDGELEKYIDDNAKNAANNTQYLTEKYIADDKAGVLDPNEFYDYYKAKKEKVAEQIIKQLEIK